VWDGEYSAPKLEAEPVFAKMLTIQVKVPLSYGMPAPQRVKVQQAGVPSPKSVRYIVDEVDIAQ